MGYFSFECKGCDQDLVEGELVRLNGCKGEYDGYGGIHGVGEGCVDYEPVAWHQKCYGEATTEQKLDETPSRHARNQGCGFPRQDCMPEGSTYVEPPRLHFKDVSSVDVRVYLESLHREDVTDRNDGETPYWFNAAEHVRLADEGDPILFVPADLTPGDYAETYLAFGDRWDHDFLDPRKARGSEYWGETEELRQKNDPGEHYWRMEEQFKGKHIAISTIAHAILARAKRRMRAE